MTDAPRNALDAAPRVERDRLDLVARLVTVAVLVAAVAVFEWLFEVLNGGENAAVALGFAGFPAWAGWAGLLMVGAGFVLLAVGPTVLLLIGLVRLLGGYADNIWFTLPALVLFAGAHFALRLRNKSSKTDEPARPAKGRGK